MKKTTLFFIILLTKVSKIIALVILLFCDAK